MGIKYLWDTNTAIYYLQQQFPPPAEACMDSILSESQPAISVITEIELLCWRNPIKKDMKVLQSFIADTFIFDLEEDIKLKTAEVRKKHKRIKLPDAIIAGTAMVFDLKLITRNIRDFKNIPGLNPINPYEA